MWRGLPVLHLPCKQHLFISILNINSVLKKTKQAEQGLIHQQERVLRQVDQWELMCHCGNWFAQYTFRKNKIEIRPGILQFSVLAI